MGPVTECSDDGMAALVSEPAPNIVEVALGAEPTIAASSSLKSSSSRSMRSGRHLVRSTIWLFIAMVLLVTTACANDGSPEVGAEANLVSTASGGEIDFGALEGTDTVLWFWAPW